MPHWLRWTLGTLLAAAALFFALTRLAHLLGTVLAGAVLAYLLGGVALRLERHMGPGWAAAAAVGSFLGAGILLLFLPAPVLAAQARELAGQLPRMLESIGSLADGAARLLARYIPSADIGALLPDLSALTDRLTRLTAGAARSGLALGGYLLSPLFAFYFLKDRHLFAEWIGYLIPIAHRDSALRIAADIHRELRHYIRGQAVVSATVGLLTALGLLALGIRAWLVLGLIMAVCNMIPFFGPWIGAAPILLVSLLQGARHIVPAAVLVLAVQQADNLILSPRIVGDSLRLHPLAVILSVLAGSALLGPAGLLLAIPLVIVLRAVCRRFFLRRIRSSAPYAS